MADVWVDAEAQGAMRMAGVGEDNAFEFPRIEDIKTRYCRCSRGMKMRVIHDDMTNAYLVNSLFPYSLANEADCVQLSMRNRRSWMST